MNRLDYRNTNTLWASVMVETLSRLGLTTAIVCPGSRSTPLTVALVRHPSIETIPILDERSAAFFALGCAKQSHQPVILVCTSGSAGANFLPAVIEAQESHIPLILLTADRPPDMRACASGQTIDQQKLFGDFVNGYGEMAIPEVKLLPYARQTMVQTWVRTLSPTPGPFHLNCPFRDPLAPLAEPLERHLDETNFFAAVLPPLLGKMGPPSLPSSLPEDLVERWSNNKRGIIVAGPTQPQHPAAYCQAVAQLSGALGWPVLAESLSPLRNYQSLNPYLISTYDSLLRHPMEQLIPDQVIQLGPLPTSKVLRQWLHQHQPLTYQVTPDARNVDPLHGRTRCLNISVEALGALFSAAKADAKVSQYCQAWVTCDRTLQKNIFHTIQSLQTPFEGKISWLLSQYLPQDTPLIIANSMPIRDMESFWHPNDRHIKPYFSRGANGIDGTLSTAMGIAHHHHHSLLLTGDLAFLHDTNGLLNTRYLKGTLTVILINNQGGGIFEMLPIANFDPPFEKYFATPQTVNIQALCHAYGIQHTLIETWEQLIPQIKALALPDQPPLRVLEFCTDRQADAHWRKTHIGSLSADLLSLS